MIQPHRLLACLLSLLLTGVAGAADPVVPIQPGERPVPNSTEAELWYGMDQAEKDIKASPLLVRDPALNEYVHGVACAVARDYCKELRVYVVDVPAFNAETAPNGIVLVFTGALLRIHDEAELALVLSHEFAHFQQRHSLQFWIKAKHTTAFLATFGVVTIAGGVGLVGGIANIVGVANVFQFSRQFERQADHIGFQIATSIGYDPQAGVRMWARIEREEKASKEHKPSPVFSSHPKTAERLEDVRAAAAAVPKGDFHDNKAAYHAATRPFLAHWLDAELSRRTFDTTIQMVGELRDGCDDDSKGTLTFYLAEAYRHRSKNDDRTTASKLYAEAIAHADAPADAWREYGLDLRQNGKPADAAAALHHYLELSPQAGDRAFIEKYLTELETHP